MTKIEFKNCQQLIFSQDKESIKLRITLLNKSFPRHTYRWACRYFGITKEEKEGKGRDFYWFWIKYIQFKYYE